MFRIILKVEASETFVFKEFRAKFFFSSAHFDVQDLTVVQCIISGNSDLLEF
jgi:hypothetical protein